MACRFGHMIVTGISVELSGHGPAAPHQPERSVDEGVVPVTGRLSLSNTDLRHEVVRYPALREQDTDLAPFLQLEGQVAGFVLGR